MFSISHQPRVILTRVKTSSTLEEVISNYKEAFDIIRNIVSAGNAVIVAEGVWHDIFLALQRKAKQIICRNNSSLTGENVGYLIAILSKENFISISEQALIKPFDDLSNIIQENRLYNVRVDGDDINIIDVYGQSGVVIINQFQDSQSSKCTIM